MTEVYYGWSYIKSFRGILKISEISANFLGLILVGVDGWNDDLLNANIVGTAIGLTITILLTLIYLTKLGRHIGKLNLIELGFYGAWFVFMLIVSAVLVSKYWGDQLVAGASFGLIAAILYLVEAVNIGIAKYTE